VRGIPRARRAVPRRVSVATTPASVLAEVLSPSRNFTGAAIASPARWVTLFTIHTWIRSRHGARYLAIRAALLPVFCRWPFVAGVGGGRQDTGAYSVAIKLD